MYDFHTLPLACELSLSFLSHECEWICTIVSSQVPDEYACTTKLFHQMVGPVSQQADSSYKGTYPFVYQNSVCAGLFTDYLHVPRKPKPESTEGHRWTA